MYAVRDKYYYYDLIERAFFFLGKALLFSFVESTGYASTSDQSTGNDPEQK